MITATMTETARMKLSRCKDMRSNNVGGCILDPGMSIE